MAALRSQAEARAVRRLAGLRWLLAIACLGLGVLGVDSASLRWSGLGLLLHALPLGLQVVPGFAPRYLGACLAGFLLAQAAVSPLLASRVLGSPDLKTLPPGLDVTIDVSPTRLPGIEGRQRITTDALGFRVTRPVDYADAAPARVFAIGASTTEQIHLDDRSTWTHGLQEGLRARGLDAEVVNTGVSGLRARHHLATLRHVLPYGPDLVVLMIGVNDWNWQVTHYFANGEREAERFDDGRGPLRLRHTLLGRALLRLLGAEPGRTWDEGQLADLLRFAEYNPQRGSLARPDRRRYRPAAVSPEFAYFVRALGAECRRPGLRCLWVSQPTGYSERASAGYRASWWMTPPGRRYTLDVASLAQLAVLYNGHVERFAREAGQPFFDLAAQLEPGFGSFYDDCHFNVAGARRVAGLLTPEVAGRLGPRER